MLTPLLYTLLGVLFNQRVRMSLCLRLSIACAKGCSSTSW